MTSNTSPSGLVTSSGIYSSEYEPWRAFNSDSSFWLSEVYEAPARLEYAWDDGPRIVTEYSIKFSNGSSLTTRAPKDWTLQGWTGLGWIVVDTQIDETGWAGTETRTYDVASPGSYEKYRLVVTQDNDSRADVVVVSIAHLDLLGPVCDCRVSQVPEMTSNTSPSGLVTSSGIYSPQYEPWRAFNSDSSFWLSEVYEAPASLEYAWEDGPRIVTEYSIKFSNGSSLTTRAPKDWTLQGWAGTDWVVVDTETGETGWAGTETRTYDVASPGSYEKYRLVVTQDNDSRADVVVVSIAHLDLLGPAYDCGISQVPEMTSNTSPSGTVTSSGIYSSEYEPWRAFNSDGSFWLSEVYEAPASLEYAWDDGPRIITDYSIKFSNGSSLTTRAPKEWTLQGWTGADWVIVDTQTGETGWAGTETRDYDVASPGLYEKYRLVVTQDNDNRADVVVVSIAHLDLVGPVCNL